MRFLVTGGAGFIGSWVCRRLLELNNNSEIIIVDNLCSGTVSRVSDLLANGNVVLHQYDLKDFSLIERSFSGVDTVYHFAANPDIAKAASDPTIDFYEGTLLTQNVIEACRQNNVKSIVYASGSGVYGEKGDASLSEDRVEMRPISPYGASKLGCEAMLCAYSHMYGIKSSCFRFGNVVGGRQTHGVGFDFLRRLKKDPNNLVILGDGSQLKPYVYIEDVVNALTSIPQKQDSIFDVFNIAPTDAISVNDIAKIVINSLSLSIEDVKLHYTGGDRGWKGDVPQVHLDTSKANKLGWKCIHSSFKAMQRSIDDMINAGEFL